MILKNKYLIGETDLLTSKWIDLLKFLMFMCYQTDEELVFMCYCFVFLQCCALRATTFKSLSNNEQEWT